MKHTRTILLILLNIAVTAGLFWIAGHLPRTLGLITGIFGLILCIEIFILQHYRKEPPFPPSFFPWKAVFAACLVFFLSLGAFHLLQSERPFFAILCVGLGALAPILVYVRDLFVLGHQTSPILLFEAEHPDIRSLLWSSNEASSPGFFCASPHQSPLWLGWPCTPEMLSFFYRTQASRTKLLLLVFLALLGVVCVIAMLVLLWEEGWGYLESFLMAGHIGLSLAVLIVLGCAFHLTCLRRTVFARPHRFLLSEHGFLLGAYSVRHSGGSVHAEFSKARQGILLRLTYTSPPTNPGEGAGRATYALPLPSGKESEIIEAFTRHGGIP